MSATKVEKENHEKEPDPESEEYEEIDLTENPLYQVLSAFFENERGENLVDHLSKLTLAIENNTKTLATAMEHNTKMLETVLASSKKSSSSSSSSNK